MQIKTFFLPATDANASSEEELNLFLRSRRIVSLEREFVSDGPNSYWSICVTYVDKQTHDKVNTPIDGQKKRIDYREILNEHDFAIFAHLRTLRKTMAEREGVPAYALFTNEQLAEIVRRNVATKSALGEISGIGTARVDKYAEHFLDAVKEAKAEFLTRNSDHAKTKSNPS